MKYLFITAIAACISTSAFAQEKKEATVKIVINENGKERVIEKKFSDLDQADAEVKKLSDSLEINVTASGGKRKIVRVDVNKSHSRMSDQPGNVIIEKIEGGPEGLEKDFNIQLDGPMRGPKNGLKKLQKWAQEKGSKTIQGLSGKQNQPFNGKINVRFNAPTKGNVTIAVSDVNGKEIATETVKDFQGDYLGQIDLKKAAAGVYFLRVTQGNDGAVRRVEVK